MKKTVISTLVFFTFPVKCIFGCILFDHLNDIHQHIYRFVYETKNWALNCFTVLLYFWNDTWLSNRIYGDRIQPTDRIHSLKTNFFEISFIFVCSVQQQVNPLYVNSIWSRQFTPSKQFIRRMIVEETTQGFIIL